MPAKKKEDNLDKLFKKVDSLARTVDEMHVNVSGIATAIIDMEKDLEYYEKDKKGEAQSTLCNSKLAREILEWKPKLNLEVCSPT